MGRAGRFPGMTYEIRQEPEQLAFGIPSDWNTRPRLTLWMAFLVGFVATMVVVGGCFMMAEGLILNGLLVIVLGLIGASPLVWRRLPHHDVLLRRPDAQEADLGIAFDQPRWRGAAAAEFYRANPKQRVEVGMEASVLRARRITAAVDPLA